MSILASIERLDVRYGDGLAALSDVSLEIASGERLAVIGESGSGKSTLALALAGLLPPTANISGGIGWPGLDRAPLPGRDIGFVFQDAGASLNPVLTVGEQIAEVARRHLGLSWRDAFGQAEALLDRVRLPDPRTARRAYPHQLSGGQRQRVAIAVAICAEPALLIADEPTSALDTIVQAEIVTLLDELVRERGMTLIFITHDIALASGLADRLAVFHRGRMVETGPTRDVLQSPRDGYTADLLAAHVDLATLPLIGAAP